VPDLLRLIPSSACIVPFLLRRNAPREVLRACAVDRITNLIETNDLTTLKGWLEVFVEQYSRSESAIKWDMESTVTLLPCASLLELNRLAMLDHVSVSSSCGPVITQTEMLQLVLIKQAMLALKEGKTEKLEDILAVAIDYMIEIERRFLFPCVALQCLVVALLWKTGENTELCSFLSTQEAQWSITRRRRQLELPTSNRLYSDSPGAVAFAETLFLIATHDTPGEINQ
jgi:hypothetical protein